MKKDCKYGIFASNIFFSLNVFVKELTATNLYGFNGLSIDSNVKLRHFCSLLSFRTSKTFCTSGKRQIFELKKVIKIIFFNYDI